MKFLHRIRMHSRELDGGSRSEPQTLNLETCNDSFTTVIAIRDSVSVAKPGNIRCKPKCPNRVAFYFIVCNCFVIALANCCLLLSANIRSQTSSRISFFSSHCSCVDQYSCSTLRLSTSKTIKMSSNCVKNVICEFIHYSSLDTIKKSAGTMKMNT